MLKITYKIRKQTINRRLAECWINLNIPIKYVLVNLDRKRTACRKKEEKEVEEEWQIYIQKD